MAMQHADDGLQIPRNSAEFPDDRPLRRHVLRLTLELVVRLCRPRQGGRDLLGVAGDLFAPHRVELHELPRPAVQQFGQCQYSF